MNCPSGMNGAIQFMQAQACNSWRSQFMTRQRQFIKEKRGPQEMKENPLIDLSKQFAVDVIGTVDAIKKRGKSSALTNQLLRCGTSIGANIHEANYAQSRADFINKMQVSLKECFETDYWLEIFLSAGVIEQQEYDDLFSQCSKLRKLLIASINTAKANQQ